MACSHATDDKKDSKEDGKAQIEIWGGCFFSLFYLISYLYLMRSKIRQVEYLYTFIGAVNQKPVYLS